MSWALCNNCGCMIDTDQEPEAYYSIDEDGNETEQNEPQCSSCQEGTY